MSSVSEKLLSVSSQLPLSLCTTSSSRPEYPYIGCCPEAGCSSSIDSIEGRGIGGSSLSQLMVGALYVEVDAAYDDVEVSRWCWCWW